jgi:hypothetical protein
MSLFKTKKSEKAAGSLVPSWHPNFRNFDRLPDVKAVRTSFFVNCAAIMITSAVLLCFVLQEYKLHEVRVQISDWQRQIDENQKPSEQAVRIYQQFQSEENKAVEVAAFVKADFVRSDFIIELGQSLPNNIALDSIDVNETGALLRGVVRGTSDEASGQAQAYINQLRADPDLGKKFGTIEMPSLNRAVTAGQLSFEISLKSKTGGRP